MKMAQFEKPEDHDPMTRALGTLIELSTMLRQFHTQHRAMTEAPPAKRNVAGLAIVAKTFSPVLAEIHTTVGELLAAMRSGTGVSS